MNINDDTKSGRCQYVFSSGIKCNKVTETHMYICDYHAEIQETKPYGQYCEFCGIDTFNVLEHKEDCPMKPSKVESDKTI